MPCPPDAVTFASGPVGLQQWLEQAEALRSNHQLADAAREYRAILVAHPADRSARRGLIATLVGQGNLGAAMPLLDQLLRDDPKDVEVWWDRAAVCRSAGNHVELLRCLQAIERLDPHDLPCLLEEYQLLDVTGAREDAYRCLSAYLAGAGAPGASPAPGPLWLKQGELAEALGRKEEAQSAYDKAATSEDRDAAAEAALRGSRLLVQAGRPDLALTTIAAALPETAAGGDPPVALLRARADLLLQVERPEEAQEVFDRLRARDPSDAGALVGAARARIEQGKHPEAREILHEGLRHVPRTEGLVLALAEAESGSGDLLAAERAVREGLEIVPESAPLWTRLAEIASARNDWEQADSAYQRVLTVNPGSLGGLLGAAFVAEQRGKATEALALYDRAAQLAPGDPRVWIRRGLALAAVQRHAEAAESFDRALSIDPESDAAREGKKLADRERRARETDALGLAALRLEAQLGRPVTKNDLFVQLKVPFDQLDTVLAGIGREVKVDIGTLEPAALTELEARSCRLITAALTRRPPGIESRGLTVADVAALSDPKDALADVQRLFAYLDTVLRMDIRPENLRLSPQSEEVARRALLLPPAQRTLFGLVRTLQIGIFQARVVKAVERASDSAHVPLPAVNLASHSPEFGGADEQADGEQFFSPENVPTASPGSPGTRRGTGHRHSSKLWPLGVKPLESQRAHARDRGAMRCVACGGLASVTHVCGAMLCAQCTRQFARCPKCNAAFAEIPSARPAPPAPTEPLRVPPSGGNPVATLLPHEAGVPSGRPRSEEKSRAVPTATPRPVEPRARATPVRRPEPKKAEEKEASLPVRRPVAGGKPAAPLAATASKPEQAVPAPALPRARRDKPDDEPRL